MLKNVDTATIDARVHTFSVARRGQLTLETFDLDMSDISISRISAGGIGGPSGGSSSSGSAESMMPGGDEMKRQGGHSDGPSQVVENTMSQDYSVAPPEGTPQVLDQGNGQAHDQSTHQK